MKLKKWNIVFDNKHKFCNIKKNNLTVFINHALLFQILGYSLVYGKLNTRLVVSKTMKWHCFVFYLYYISPCPWRTSVTWKGEMDCMGNCRSPIKILSKPTHWGGHCKKNTSWIKTPQAQIPGLSRFHTHTEFYLILIM